MLHRGNRRTKRKILFMSLSVGSMEMEMKLKRNQG